MASEWIRGRVVDHSFGVLDAGIMPAGAADYSTGLVLDMAVGARIYKGIDTGPVRVRAVAAASRPAEGHDEAGNWPEVAEASAQAPQGLRAEHHAPLSSAGEAW
ncbi:hypothetical protein ACIQGZ_17725 [Streptomyces sp. NPDC092296]|uniref:hypothetical protein n=1 Tax=Streptomyces sp. NPDC092296 TaxID=3366012 RepID=UPI00380FBBBD